MKKSEKIYIVIVVAVCAFALIVFMHFSTSSDATKAVGTTEYIPSTFAADVTSVTDTTDVATSSPYVGEMTSAASGADTTVATSADTTETTTTEKATKATTEKEKTTAKATTTKATTTAQNSGFTVSDAEQALKNYYGKDYTITAGTLNDDATCTFTVLVANTTKTYATVKVDITNGDADEKLKSSGKTNHFNVFV